MSDPRTHVGRVAPAAPTAPAQAARAGRNAAAPGFDALLGSKLAEAPQPVRWSAHAVQRLGQRQLAVTPEMQQRLEGAVDRLAAKGGREAIVMMDTLAVVVSVTNRTVITAVDQDGMKDQVFTNIDSAAIS
jgi:flagellar operon protein